MSGGEESARRARRRGGFCSRRRSNGKKRRRRFDRFAFLLFFSSSFLCSDPLPRRAQSRARAPSRALRCCTRSGERSGETRGRGRGEIGALLRLASEEWSEGELCLAFFFFPLALPLSLSTFSSCSSALKLRKGTQRSPPHPSVALVSCPRPPAGTSALGLRPPLGTRGVAREGGGEAEKRRRSSFLALIEQSKREQANKQRRRGQPLFLVALSLARGGIGISRQLHLRVVDVFSLASGRGELPCMRWRRRARRERLWRRSLAFAMRSPAAARRRWGKCHCAPSSSLRFSPRSVLPESSELVSLHRI